jgi:glycosyltransferase involved in cell wall biosynthesis
MYEALRTETTDIALGQRVSRKDTLRTKTFANLYWAMYRKFVLADIPKGGIDVFACNRKVINTLLTIEEPNSSLIAQLFWVGYRRTFIPYERKARQIGTSSWSFKKKLKYMLDSIFSYSDGPLMLIFWAGLISFGLSSVIGFATLLGKLMGWISVPGYTALTLLILFFGSTIIFTQGIIGCYLWRAFENTKRRPLSIVKSEYSFNEIEK